MPVCEVCGEEEFTELEGHFYCTTCQTQSQDVRVVEQEEEYGQWAGHSNKITEKRGDKPKKKEKEDRGRPWSIYEAYQIIIQHQVEALIKLGAQESLKDVVFKVWVNYLSRQGVAFSDKPRFDVSKKLRQREMYPGTTKNPDIKNVGSQKKRRKIFGVSSKKAEKMQLADKVRQAFGKEKFYDGDNPLADDNPAADSSDIDDYSSEEDAMTYQKKVISIYDMKMKFTLAFCYVGLLYTNPGTTASDLIRWVRQDKVPYLAAVSLLPEDFKFSVSDYSYFGMGKIITTEQLRTLTGSLCCYLGLTDFPEFPMAELISRYLLILDLPDPYLSSPELESKTTLTYMMAEMHSLVINLYKSKSVSISYKPTKSYHRLPFWDGLALSYIIIALKLYVGLNDHTERVISVYSRELMKLIDNSHQLFVWEDWVKHMKRKCLTSEYFTYSSQQQSMNVEFLSEEANANALTGIKRTSDAQTKLRQTKVREKITRPFTELGKRRQNKEKTAENQSCVNTTSDLLDLDNFSNTLMDEDPVGLLMGHYDNNEQDQCEEGTEDRDVNARENDLKHTSEMFRRSSLKHLSNPESYLEELDKHGLSDYTILSSCASSAESDEDSEPEYGYHNDQDWDPEFTHSGIAKSDGKRDAQSDSQKSLKEFIKANVKSVPSFSKVGDKTRYETVIEQVRKIHENFLLTFDPDQWSDCLSYNWLLQLCGQLIDCPVSELANEVKKVEVRLFAEIDDISKKGRYNYKNLKKLNNFTKKLKKF